VADQCPSPPVRLHIGGRQSKPGWTILNIQSGPGVDVVGSCTDLGAFADGSVDEIYASHVYEHLGLRQELPKALSEASRVLKSGCLLRVSVPDIEILCRLFLHPQLSTRDRLHVIMHMFGAQEDAHDFHRVGLSMDILGEYLRGSGFTDIRRVEDFGLFDDFSTFRRFGVPISLNLEATRG